MTLYNMIFEEASVLLTDKLYTEPEYPNHLKYTL